MEMEEARDAIRSEWMGALHDMDRETMMRLCAVSGDCEVGIAQRTYGAEPLDLLRWSNTGIGPLVRMLEARFDGIDRIEVQTLPSGEHRVRHTGYGITYHAFANARSHAAEAIHEREVRRLPFLARKLVEDLEAGERIFVVKWGPRTPYGVTKRLRAAFDRYGSPRVLLVKQGAEPEVNDYDGFLWGTVPVFADPAGVTLTTDAPAWLRLAELAAAH